MFSQARVEELQRISQVTTVDTRSTEVRDARPIPPRSRRQAWTERRTSNDGLLWFRTSEPLSNGKGIGQRFKRADGRADLSVYSLPNEAGETPATYLRHNLRMDRSVLDYTRIARSFFAISSEREGVILYSRCNFSKRGRGAIHCFDLVYPQEAKRSWDAVVTRISLSLRPLEG